ncbi:hypothetical protein [Nostoc sp.]
MSHFSHQFRQYRGLPPQAWRKEHQLGSEKQVKVLKAEIQQF